MSSETQPYRYSPLDDSKEEIRLLTLFPSDRLEDPLRIDLSHVSFIVSQYCQKEPLDRQAVEETLPPGGTAAETREGQILFVHEDEHGRIKTSWTHPTHDEEIAKEYRKPDDCPSFEPAYEALSYTWGSLDNLDSAHVTDQGLIKVGENLSHALRHLRLTDRSRVLWIDAICINQDDTSERSAQVPRMANIYKYADKVVVWLGVSTPSSSAALHALDLLGREIELTRTSHLLPSPNSDFARQVHDGDTPLTYDNEVIEALLELLGRPWFDRVWIVQEIQLANSKAMMQCGQYQIRWYFFRRAIRCLNAKRYGVLLPLRSLVSVLSNLCGKFVGQPFYMLRGQARGQSCSEAVDKVYGILGLCSQEMADRIRPDYSLSTSDAFKSILLEYLALTNRLDLLDFCNIENRSGSSPSWILSLAAMDMVNKISENASGCSCADWEYVEPDTLKATGVKVSEIGAISPVFKRYDELVDFIRGLEGEGLSESSCAGGGALVDAYARVLTIGLWSERYAQPHPSYPKLASVKRTILEVANRADPNAQPFRDVLNQIYRFVRNRKMFRLQNGQIGIGPAGTQIDDVVCVLLGSQSPLVLRLSEPGLKYELVGTATYVDGIMDAETFLGPLPENWQCQFRLSPSGFETPGYLNVATGYWELPMGDPRLGQYAEGWALERRNQPSRVDLLNYQNWKNKLTGERASSDPRLFPEALRTRGVGLEVFCLV